MVDGKVVIEFLLVWKFMSSKKWGSTDDCIIQLSHMVHEDTLLTTYCFFAGGVGVLPITTSVHAEGFMTLRKHEHIVQPFTRLESGPEMCFIRWYWRD